MNKVPRILTIVLAVLLVACQPKGTAPKSAESHPSGSASNYRQSERNGMENNSQENGNIKKERKKTTMNVKELTTAEFKEKVMNYDLHPQEWIFEGDKPALIDFYATWCGPCKATAPVVEEMAEKYNGKIDVYKVDVDKEEELAAVFGIRSIPTLLFIPKNGQPQMQVGAMSRSQMDEAIQKVLF